MEPKFHIGDLVITHREPTYQVGDAIVYRNQELKNFVFHRIISQEMGHYALKGDNNSWVDTYRPSHMEVIGKLWLYIPQGGTAMQKIRSPITMALIAGALGAVLATSLFISKTKGNNRMSNKSVRQWFASIKQKTRSWLAKKNDPNPQKSSNLDHGGLLEGSFFVLGLIALSSLILGILAFSRPAFRVAQDDISYEHLGVFSYSASAPLGVYDLNIINSGDPIFTKLTCSVDVNLQYTLVAAQAEYIAGTYQLTAIISEQVSGWQRVVPLQEEASFVGTAFGTKASLDLCKIESLTQSLEQGTDFHPGSYTLIITPKIQINGEVSGRALESSFDPGLTFRYDRVQFYLVRNDEQGNPLTVTETGLLREKHKEANTILLFGREIAIPTLRLIALFGLLGSLSALVVLGLRLQNLSRFNQEKFFRIKYDSMMIDVQNEIQITSSNIINVASIENLAKLAERFNAMILHEKNGSEHNYYVQANGTLYRFMINTDKMDPPIADASPEAISQEGGT